MRTTFIFISLLILRASCSNLTLSKKLKDRLFEPKDCLPKIIETYTASNAPQRSVQSDESMLALCPHLQESCCLKNNLNDLHALVVDSVDALKTFENQYKYLVDTVNNASPSTVQGLLKKLEEKFQANLANEILDDEEEESYEEPKEVGVLRDAVEYIQTNKRAIASDLALAIEFVIATNSRFGCALCDRENLYSFKNMKTRKPTLVLDMAQCKEIFDDDRVFSLYRLDVHTRAVYDLVRSMMLLEKGSAPNDTFLSEEEFSNLTQLAESCKEDLQFIQKPECQNLCTELQFLNGNPFFHIEKSVIAGALVIDTYFKNKANMSEQELNQEYEKLEERVVRQLFIMPHLKDTIHIEFLEKELSWNNGWNIMKFEMNWETATQPVINKKMEDYILRAVRSPEELFQKTNRDVAYVESRSDSNSSKIVSYIILALTFFLYSN